MELSHKERLIVNKWIKELTEAGLTPDQMLEVFRLARIKWQNLKRLNSKNMLLPFSNPKFESLIKESVKQHTIRADKNNRWKVGNTIQFWNGNPRNVHAKNKPYQFGTGVCSRIENIIMNFQMSSEDNPDSVTIGQTQLKTIEELNALAVNDGFDNWYQMRIFFERHGECFVGKMIFWNNCVWL